MNVCSSLVVVAAVVLAVPAQAGAEPESWATASSGAVRETPPSPRDQVNGLTYSYGDAWPAMFAYRQVATARGWTPDRVERWAPFLERVFRAESGFCPNVRRGARFAAGGAGCVLTRQGVGSDSGFGQVISIWWRPDDPQAAVCVETGLCSAEQITANAWDSMVAALVLVEHDGARPWCFFNARTGRRQHPTICSTAPTT